MGNNKSVRIHNGTHETVKICLMNANMQPVDMILSAGETWERQSESNSKVGSVVIIPLNREQNTFTYTIRDYISTLLIKKKLSKLVLVPSWPEEPSVEISSLEQNHFSILGCQQEEIVTSVDPAIYEVAPKIGCIVFNESHEPIKVCVTDGDQRNTHLILDHGEHGVVITGKANLVLPNQYPTLLVPY